MESKQEIDSGDAVDKIREYIYNMPNLYDNTEKINAFFEMQMGNILPEEYRKIIGLN